MQILGEFGQGESVGELDCITGATRPSTLHAIRDSELARMPLTLFNAISVRHPLVTIQISRIIASRVRQQMDSKTLTIPRTLDYGGANEMGRNNFNLKVRAIPFFWLSGDRRPDGGGRVRSVDGRHFAQQSPCARL